MLEVMAWRSEGWWRAAVCLPSKLEPVEISTVTPLHHLHCLASTQLITSTHYNHSK